MANFKQTVITKAAHNLMAKSLAGSANINFTRVATSKYDYKSFSQSKLESLTSLEDIKQYVQIDKVEKLGNASVNVITKITNAKLTEGYYVNAIGLFAMDPEEGEILYSVTVAETADYFPADNGVNCSGINLDLVTEVSNASNVNITVNYAGYATNEDIEKVNAQMNEKVNKATLGYVTPEMFGAKGDGIRDDTVAIQSAINNGDIVVLTKKYFVSATSKKTIALKGKDINISIEIPSNKKIFISGSIIADNTMFNIFYSEGSNIVLSGGTITLPNLSTSGTYQMGAIALNGSKHVTIDNVSCNNAIVTCFSCKYITTSKCASIRNADNKMNCAIGYHNTSYSNMLHNVVVGTHNDGDLLTFGSCTGNIIDGNSLFSTSEYYTDLASQGICVDSGNYKAKVINNYLTGYYNPIDVKTWANGNIVSGNTLFANKQGITIRRGEANQNNYVDMITNNYIDLGGGNGSSSEIVGSGGITESSYNVCGIYVESVSSVIISNNIIETTVNTPSAIGIMLTDIMENATIKIDNNKFSSMHFEGTTRYFKGVFIMSNGSDIKKAWVSITNNEFSLGDPADNYVQYLNLRYIRHLTISGNVLTGGTIAPLVINCTNVYITGNNGEVKSNMLQVKNTNLVMLTGNSLYNSNGTIVHLLDLTNVTNSISNGNSIFSATSSLIDTGCAHSTDTIIKS